MTLGRQKELSHFLEPRSSCRPDVEPPVSRAATPQPESAVPLPSYDAEGLAEEPSPELPDRKATAASAGTLGLDQHDARIGNDGQLEIAARESLDEARSAHSPSFDPVSKTEKPGEKVRQPSKETNDAIARPPQRTQCQSILNYLVICPGRPGQKCGSIDLISKGEGNRWQCKRCGYRFRHRPTDLSPDLVRVAEIFFDSGGSRAATVRNCKKVGIDITECQVDNILIKIAANTKRTIDVMKEAGVTSGILLPDGTHHKLRASEIPQLIALDLKNKLVINDAFAEETYTNTLPFVKELKEAGYNVDPYAIIDNSDAWYKATRQVYSCDIQICVVHEQRNVLESGLPADEDCSDQQLAVKKLGTSILFVGGHSIRSYKRALEKAKKYRERLRAMLSRVDQATSSVVSSLLRNFNDITTHLRHRSPHRDTNSLENVIRLIKKPVKIALRQYENKELVKAVLKLAVMRYDASILGIKDWVRWSQKTPN